MESLTDRSRRWWVQQVPMPRQQTRHRCRIWDPSFWYSNSRHSCSIVYLHFEVLRLVQQMRRLASSYSGFPFTLIMVWTGGNIDGRNARERMKLNNRIQFYHEENCCNPSHPPSQIYLESQGGRIIKLLKLLRTSTSALDFAALRKAVRYIADRPRLHIQ